MCLRFRLLIDDLPHKKRCLGHEVLPALKLLAWTKWASKLEIT